MILLFLPLFRCALPGTAQDEAACYQERPGPPVTQTLSSGNNDAELGCEAIVRDQGFNTRIHPVTGKDIDNDGRPDAVVGIDTGGGNRCCWEYAILSLGTSPHLLVKLPTPVFDFENTPGKVLVWTTTAFYELGASLADSPAVKTVHENDELVSYRKGLKSSR